ncbi:hypothetical protein D0T84_00755 [Dysgonomonas sp. 521]|uniref:hypothetical protein n=1 Tax=Dysgonomonas sp. 521 TaxID=2302932 RepID=UPI0013D77326|nr:hypothetical protein [Dysgonomonas sp. 521]NDV93447.1 hypothetical protein [Dysgonomonas sp. 521]
MNEAAQLVSEALLGLDSKTIFICGKAYEIKPPTIKIMCLGLNEWAKIDLNLKEQTNLSLAIQIPENAKRQLKGISKFIAGDTIYSDKIYNEWVNNEPSVTQEELDFAVDTILSLIDKEKVFRSAQGCLSAAKIIARPK